MATTQQPTALKPAPVAKNDRRSALIPVAAVISMVLTIAAVAGISMSLVATPEAELAPALADVSLMPASKTA